MGKFLKEKPKRKFMVPKGTVALAVIVVIVLAFTLNPLLLPKEAYCYSFSRPNSKFNNNLYLHYGNITDNKTKSTNSTYFCKQNQTKSMGAELEIFKGRGAKLNRAIFLALGYKEPQTTRSIFKTIIQIRTMKNTAYSTVNIRVRELETLGYLTKVEAKPMPGGGFANYYALTPIAYLAEFFDSYTIQNFFEKADKQKALATVGVLFDLVAGAPEQ